MTAVVKPITIEQGATFLWDFQWCQQGVDESTPGAPYDLTGWTGRMQVRKSQGAPALVSASTTNEKIIFGADPDDPATDPLEGGTPDPTNGFIRVFLTDDDTDLLTVKSGKYDLEVESPGGIVYRLLKGDVTVDANITQETDDPPVEG